MRHRMLNYLIAIQILLVSDLFAQLGQIKFTVFQNTSFPTGPFAETIGDEPRITRRFGFDYGKEVGLARVGAGIGIEVSQTVLNENLNWVLSTRFLANAVDNSQITTHFREELADSVALSFEHGTWMNVPIFTGFAYHIGLFSNVQIYGTLQAGLNITRQPYRKASVDREIVEETTFRTTPNFGYELGFGFKILKKYDIGFRYINLGNPRYDGTRALNESFFTSIPKRRMNIDGDEKPISMFLIFAGYSL